MSYTLEHFFTGKFFKIPNYQRDYSWVSGRDQVAKKNKKALLVYFSFHFYLDSLPNDELGSF